MLELGRSHKVSMKNFSKLLDGHARYLYSESCQGDGGKIRCRAGAMAGEGGDQLVGNWVAGQCLHFDNVGVTD